MHEQTDKQLLVPRRYHTHRLTAPLFPTPTTAVAHFAAVQGQDTLTSLWALGLRVEGATEAGVEQAIADRQFVRTWPMRTTLHYVTAADARWMVKLNAERTLRGMARRLRELELDDATFAHSRRAIEGALAPGEPLNRPALYAALEAAGVSPAGQRGYYLILYHALEELIAIGPRQDKQQTIVLLDAWLPPAPERTRDEALAELAWRYFAGHGPATIKDYIWWSGLAAAEARAGLAMAQSRLAQESIGDESYWFDPAAPVDEIPSPTAHLLPFVDEYLIGYKDRSAVLPDAYNALVDSGGVIFHQPIVIDGRVAGIWVRKIKKSGVVVTATLFRALNAAEMSAVASAADHLGHFLGLPAEVKYVP